MRLVVDDPVSAKNSLTAKGFVTRVSDVIGVELKDEQGNLNPDAENTCRTERST